MAVMPHPAAALVTVPRLARHCVRGLTAILAGAALAAVLIWATVPLRAAPVDAMVVVGQFNDSLLTAMAQGGKLGFRRRFNILAGPVDTTFDLALMTRVAVGPGWANLPEDQQRRITEGFRRFLTATLADRFDDFAGEKFEIQGTRPMGTGTLVENQLVTPAGEHIQINYLMHETPEGWRVVDVYLNGTISELAVHRSEFTSILKRSGPEGLIITLERKTADARVPG